MLHTIFSVLLSAALLVGYPATAQNCEHPFQSIWVSTGDRGETAYVVYVKDGTTMAKPARSDMPDPRSLNSGNKRFIAQFPFPTQDVFSGEIRIVGYTIGVKPNGSNIVRLRHDEVVASLRALIDRCLPNAFVANLGTF